MGKQNIIAVLEIISIINNFFVTVYNFNHVVTKKKKVQLNYTEQKVKKKNGRKKEQNKNREKPVTK